MKIIFKNPPYPEYDCLNLTATSVVELLRLT